MSADSPLHSGPDRRRFPLPIAPSSQYHAEPKDADGLVSLVGALLAIVLVAYSFLLSMIAFCCALVLVVFIVAVARACAKWARDRRERRRVSVEATINKQVPGAYIHADVASMTSELWGTLDFFVMRSTTKTSGEPGSAADMTVVYDIHQVHKAWPLLFDADDSWKQLFERALVVRLDGARVDGHDVIYTAKHGVSAFEPFLSGEARAALYRHRLVG